MDDRFKNANILIVDDEYANVLLLERTFAQAGFKNITGVSDPTHVLDLIKIFTPDIVLLDLNMPVLDGFAIMKLVKQAPGSECQMPILVLTADVSQATRRKALAEGATDYLTKPFDLFEVILRTKNLLHTRFLHKDLMTQNAMLEERVYERTKDVEAAHREAIERLAKACEARDDATGEHTERVGELSARIARSIGMPDEQAAMLCLAAQLHDIGKTGIPDAILLKPAKLTEAEYEVMKTHAAIGARILAGSNVPLLKLAEEIANTHHEWWSGAGYPNQLFGEQIPLAGRIVAVADVFDSLTHARPYKQAWTVDAAVAEIRRASATQFDPDLVNALCEVLATDGLIEIDESPGFAIAA